MAKRKHPRTRKRPVTVAPEEQAVSPVDEAPVVPRDRSGLAAAWGTALVAVVAVAFLLSGWSPGPSPARVEAGGAIVVEPERPPTETTPAKGLPPRQLFQVFCGQCHTLADAVTSGDLGPDLDELAPGRARVLAAIERGGLGSGEMPANLLDGDRAERVAAYVAAATRKP